jgi:hypothetical protein
MIKPKIFIGSPTEKLDIAYAIQENLQNDAETTVWTQAVFDLNSNVLGEIIKELNQTDFGVFVFLPDDRLTIRAKEYTAIRDNVLFEYGLFVGRLGRSRCVYVIPRNSQHIWMPTDLAGVVAAKYDPDAHNLVAALGPACAAIRRKIKDLGIRESRFRIFPIEGGGSDRLRAVSGTWKGTLEQRRGTKGWFGTASFAFNFTPTMEGLVGDGFIEIPNSKFFVWLRGSFLLGRYLKVEFRNKDDRAFHCASIIFELNGLGNKLEGQYVGYGAFSDAIVSGTMILEPEAPGRS